jgi:hypothetical protein
VNGRRANAIGVHSSSSELYRNDTTDPRFVELYVWVGALYQMVGGGIAIGRIVSATMAGVIPHGSVFTMDALSPWFRNNLKSDGFEMQRCVRKKSL